MGNKNDGEAEEHAPSQSSAVPHVNCSVTTLEPRRIVQLAHLGKTYNEGALMMNESTLEHNKGAQSPPYYEGQPAVLRRSTCRTTMVSLPYYEGQPAVLYSDTKILTTR